MSTSVSESAFPLADAAKEVQLATSEIMNVKRAVSAARQESGFPLSDVSLRYVAALADPRSCYEEPCVPKQTCYSEKNRVYVRGSFTTGTTGYGYITATPIANNDGNMVGFSTSTSVMAPTTLVSAVTNTSAATNNSRYVGINFGTGSGNIVQRPVGFALYVRYADRELNRGGDYVLFEEPNHNSCLQYSYTSALAQDGAKRVPITQDWVRVCWTPNSDAETGWSPSYAPLNSAGAANTTPPLAVFVNGAGQAGLAFEYEAHLWFEASGSLCRSATVSFNDVIGYSCIQGAANMYQQLDSVLGVDGLMRAIHAQQKNMSGHLVAGAPHGNWAGLLGFLPSLASAVGPAALAMGKVALDHFTGRKQATPARAAKKVAKAVIKQEKKLIKKKSK